MQVLQAASTPLFLYELWDRDGQVVNRWSAQIQPDHRLPHDEAIKVAKLLAGAPRLCNALSAIVAAGTVTGGLLFEAREALSAAGYTFEQETTNAG